MNFTIRKFVRIAVKKNLLINLIKVLTDEMDSVVYVKNVLTPIIVNILLKILKPANERQKVVSDTVLPILKRN